ncbi:hypothetical protein ABE41_017320 [Fictibacillus arsenicus]|uniref:SLH domain-containing protein n=1 Tax=Fictibacillus arsenicus TaxID=255247 RepID=A0A1B1Z8I0_9BACL|nr:S-layer homology domain-containing protein [Fictibacillus arsenicus]ANX13773.1 hypothetical protein ABE41_017320 [Fictibacillus arsenicus]
MKIKSLFGSLLAASIIVSPVNQITAHAEEGEYADPWFKYSSVDLNGHWAENDMNDMIQANIMKGVRGSDTLLYAMPNKSITRAEFTALIVRALELKTDQQGKSFTDTTKHWAKNDINTASALGIVSGKSDTEFKPDLKITRAEIAAILARAFDPTVTFENGTPKEFEDLKPGYWAYNDVRKVSGVNIIKGITATTVAPDKLASRAEATAMLKRALWLEDVDLYLEGSVIKNETDIINAMNSKDTNALFTMNDKARYSLAHEYSKMEAEILEEIFASGDLVSAEIVSQPQEISSTMSTRFAKMDVQNLLVEYNSTFTDPDTGETYEDTTTEDKSGTYYFIKRNGEWKVYSSDWLKEYIEFEEYEEE